MTKAANKSSKLGKLLGIIIIGIISLSLILYFMRLPVQMADWFVTFNVEEPNYKPEEINNKYSKIVSRNKVKTIYEYNDGTLTIWASSEIGWTKGEIWGENVSLLVGEKTAFYQKERNFQMVSFDTQGVEYKIEYIGEGFSKEELIEVANIIVIAKYA
ncbi:hypothetical protein [Paenisporosarcina sp. TG20]|uniref:hypothetical protein n=1 Tax=Paenisporosarcina sp. TG20 TaxID=1211706 RepID=UPI00031822D6|nr:hypothetical protein [Paenisporosarcina sp. TG20]